MNLVFRARHMLSLALFRGFLDCLDFFGLFIMEIRFNSIIIEIAVLVGNKNTSFS